jgi:glucose-6-phosphate dehydrogenase assembly protein OpcA
MTSGLSPENILRELAGLWVSLGKEERPETSAGVLRACTLTLIVLAEESEDAAALGETLAALMPEHPARAIVIRLRGAGGHELSSRVSAQCWMPFGQRRQICSEQVEIAASDDALADLPPLVLPLSAPDLPVVVWCRSRRLSEMPEFAQIAAMACKVVLQSERAADLKLLAGFAAGGMNLGDLAWTRMTRWREALAQFFDNRLNLELVPRVSRIEIAFGPPMETSALYMAAWLRDSLADAGIHAEPFLSRQAPGSALAVELAGEGVRMRLAREGDRLVMTPDGSSTYTGLSQPTDHLLMGEELGIVRRDPVFEKTLASAARLAYAGDK